MLLCKLTQLKCQKHAVAEVLCNLATTSIISIISADAGTNVNFSMQTCLMLWRIWFLNVLLLEQAK